MNEYGYKVPSHEEIVSNFDNHCLHPHCTACTFNNTKKPNALYECAIRFTKAVLSGDMRLTDSFRVEEPKPTLPPSWCTEGFWVTDNDCKVSSIYEVIESNATTLSGTTLTTMARFRFVTALTKNSPNLKRRFYEA